MNENEKIDTYSQGSLYDHFFPVAEFHPVWLIFASSLSLYQTFSSCNDSSCRRILQKYTVSCWIMLPYDFWSEVLTSQANHFDFCCSDHHCHLLVGQVQLSRQHYQLPDFHCFRWQESIWAASAAFYQASKLRGRLANCYCGLCRIKIDFHPMNSNDQSLLSCLHKEYCQFDREKHFIAEWNPVAQEIAALLRSNRREASTALLITHFSDS